MPTPASIPEADRDSHDTSQLVTCETNAVTLRLSAEAVNQVAAVAKALSHPVRVQIVDILSRYAGEICVCEIEQLFSLTQPTISHHLKVLRQAGIVETDQRGLWVYYHLKAHTFTALSDFLSQIK
jgi:ArsR family transcriptional regulator